MQSSSLFIDTSGWGNLIDASQPYHQIAVISVNPTYGEERSDFNNPYSH